MSHHRDYISLRWLNLGWKDLTSAPAGVWLLHTGWQGPHTRAVGARPDTYGGVFALGACSYHDECLYANTGSPWLATALLGFLILMPLIGHATWHAYKETIDASAWPKNNPG